VAFVAVAAPVNPKESVRLLSPTSAETAHAPKKIIRNMTPETTTRNVAGTGSLRLAINLAHISGSAL
jgi:hypothetical protein